MKNPLGEPHLMPDSPVYRRAALTSDYFIGVGNKILDLLRESDYSEQSDSVSHP